MGKKGKSKKTFKRFDIDNVSMESNVSSTVRNKPNTNSCNLNTSGTTPTNSWCVDGTAKCQQKASDVSPGRHRRDAKASSNVSQGDETWSDDCGDNTIIPSDLVESIGNVNIDNQNDIAGILKEHTPNTDWDDLGKITSDYSVKEGTISKSNQLDRLSVANSLGSQNDKYLRRNTDKTYSKQHNDNSSQHNVTDRRKSQTRDQFKSEDVSSKPDDYNTWTDTKGTKLNVNAQAFEPPGVKSAMPELSPGNLAESNNPDAKDDYFYNNQSQQRQKKNDKRGYSTGEARNKNSRDNRNMRKSDVDRNQRFDDVRGKKYLSKSYSGGSEDTSFKQNKSYSSGNSRISRQSDPFHRSSENVDSEYKEFEEEEKKKINIEFIRVTEIEKDLFTMPKEYSLAHCVAEDMRMGSGIAVNFRRDFKDLDSLLNQRQKQGGLAVLEVPIEGGIRYIYYLVTKRESTGKPTYLKFWSSIKKMRDHIDEHQVKKLAIPKLGCGLDRLEWTRVKHMIEFLFKNVDIEIVVCNFQQSEDAVEKLPQTHSCKVVHVKKPVADIDNETAIIYFSTEDAHISTEMEQLGKKFVFLQQFKQASKNLGDVITYTCPKNQGYYILYGCIVRKTTKHALDFVSLRKCVTQINKNIRKEGYYYVAYQAIEDNDDLINEKIITILRNYFTNSEIYICWDGDLAQNMPYSNKDSSFN